LGVRCEKECTVSRSAYELFPLLTNFEPAFMAEGQRYLLVSNSLAEDVRFRVDSVLYRFDG
jgi:hypothetical protein